jgi:hypothetical protein
MCQGGGGYRSEKENEKIVGLVSRSSRFWGIDQVRTILEGVGGSRMLLLSDILALDFGCGHRPDWSNRAHAGKVVVTAAMDDDGGEGIG